MADFDEWLNSMTSLCPQCEEAFMKKNQKQRFCGSKCARAWHNRERQRLVELARKAEKGTKT